MTNPLSHNCIKIRVFRNYFEIRPYKEKGLGGQARTDMDDQIPNHVRYTSLLKCTIMNKGLRSWLKIYDL